MTPTVPSPLSAAKRQRLQGLSTPEGVIAALAMDQRKSLRRMIAEAVPTDLDAITDAQLSEFKATVTRGLTPHASAVLLDPEYGLEAARQRAPGCGLLMTYEADGYENPRPRKMLALMPRESVRRLRDRGADGIKILLSYCPEEDEEANDEKRALVERIGHECEALDVPFFLEPVVYDPAGADPKSRAFALRKPEWVIRTMEEFSHERYRVDVLKVEFPVNAGFVTGSAVARGEPAFSEADALSLYRAADQATRLPYIYLSAGVRSAEFVASLQLATAAGAAFSGVLCGRANWQDGVPAYARGGPEALTSWLETDGARNIQAVNTCLRAATPWHARLPDSSSP